MSILTLESIIYTVKNGVLWYAVLGVVEEWPFQHPCLAPIFFSKIAVECIPTLWTIVHYVSMHPTIILLEKMGAKQGCWNGHSSTTPDKVYHNTPFLTV